MTGFVVQGHICTFKQDKNTEDNFFFKAKPSEIKR